MKYVLTLCMASFFVALGLVAACIGECPVPADNERGNFTITESTPEYLTNGTIEIRDRDVEIVYSDAESNVWHVVYRIVDEK